MIGPHSGLGRGLGITTSAIDAVPAGLPKRTNPKPPCGCPSIYRHLTVCPTAHPEIAALPAEMPRGVSIDVDGEVMGQIVALNLDSVTEAYLLPIHARAVARALLLAADEAERAQ